MKKKTKQTLTTVLNIFLFIVLSGSAFAVSEIFGLLFVLGFVISIYNKDVKRKPGKTFLIFLGGLLTRFALGRALTELPNYSITLDFAVAILMVVFIFLLGWKIKTK